MPSDEKKKLSGVLRKGCLAPVLALALLALGAIALVKILRVRALARQEEIAQQEFTPVLDKLTDASSSNEDYDIDQTVRVLHEIDLAVEQNGSMKEYLAHLARQDYRGAAPEVLQARKRILDLLFRLYARQVESEDQEAMWTFSRQLMPALSALSMMEGGVAIPGTGSFSVDRDQTKRVLEDMKEQQRAHERFLREVNELESELIQAMFETSEVYYRYMAEWGRLCVLRDRAYLAAHEGNWQASLETAEAAVALAPTEREAHLLRALALIEAPEISPERAQQVPQLLADYLERHPERSAPALLLLGAWHSRQGNGEEARLNLQQAAAYYPRQSEQLTDLLDPYQRRSFLRKSREGNFILGLYRATMLGAGWFSPDLQLARTHFESGDFEQGRAKVMDHFSRRRNQERWDLILSDIRFCETLLGEHYRLIFPEDGWLDLVAEPTLLGSKLDLAVDNRSEHVLRNATLVLCVQFTDMHPEDYETFALPTEPAVLAHERTSFETLEIRFELYGQSKDVDDIVQHRAVLVSNEAVVWVDTDEYKIAEAQEFRERRMQRRAEGAWNPAAQPSSTSNRLTNTALAALEQGVSLNVVPGLGKDDVHVALPRMLSVLKPVFRLKLGDKLHSPQKNLIVEEQIRISFEDVHNFDDQRLPAILLLADCFLTELVLTWTPNEDGSWLFQGVTRSD